MAYGFIKPKAPPCPNGGEKGKHKWTFEKNFTQTNASYGARGATMRATLKGFYRCACGGTRVGQPNHNAPGADLRALLGVAE